MSDQPLHQVAGKEMADAAPDAGKPSGSAASGLMGTIDGILKLLVGSVGVVAAMGFPAAYLQLARFHIPANVISRSQILEAGIVPAILSILVIGYLIFASRAVKQHGLRHFFSVHGLLLVPPVIVTLLVAAVGALSLALLDIWALLWVGAHLMAFVAPLHPTSKELLKISAWLVGSAVLVYGAARLTYRWWQHRPGLPWTLLRKYVDPRRVVRRHGSGKQTIASNQLDSEMSSPTSPHTEDDESWGKLLLMLSLLLPVVFALMGYALKGVVHIWRPDLSIFLTHRRILLFAAIGGLVYSGFMAITVLDSKGKPERSRRGFGLVLLVVAVLYIMSVGVYSKTLYPRLPLGLGGGRPTAVRLWLPKGQPHSDISSVLRRATVVEVGDLVELSGVFVLHSSSDDVLLVDAVTPPASAMLIARTRFISVSW